MADEHAMDTLTVAEQALASIPLPHGARPVPWQELSGVATKTRFGGAKTSRNEMLPLRIELGRTQMGREEALELRSGSAVPLDNSAADPVDIYADGQLIARGEVLAIDGNFGVRVTELINQ